jgi:hypothetical protein
MRGVTRFTRLLLHTGSWIAPCRISSLAKHGSLPSSDSGAFRRDLGATASGQDRRDSTTRRKSAGIPGHFRTEAAGYGHERTRSVDFVRLFRFQKHPVNPDGFLPRVAFRRNLDATASNVPYNTGQTGRGCALICPSPFACKEANGYVRWYPKEDDHIHGSHADTG